MPTAAWTAIIGAVGGFASGSVVAAWANWGVEKRRLKLQRRYDLLDTWRKGIASIGAEFGLNPVGSPWYETLGPYLAKDVLARLERPNTVIVSPGSARGNKDLFTGEVDRIEREWKLRP
jgi:hypothetical protein